MSELTERQKAEAWDKVAEAWLTYCHEGAGAFDWDYDSRDVMTALTGHRAFEHRFGCALAEETTP